jgi:hypothetical protein
MATHDYVIANQGFPAFRSDLNDALAAIVSNNSSATEPTTMFAHMIWVDTAADPSILKIRNADNDAWITIGTINQTGDTFTLTSAVSATTLSASGVTTVQAGTNSAPAITTTGDTNTGIFFPAADTIAFAEGGVEAMRIDSSGNLGLRVTPSAWGGAVGNGVFQNKSYFSISPYISLPLNFLTNNAYFDGTNWKYLTSNPVTQQTFDQTGVISFGGAASGTAGNNVTFTERMRIDSDGNLLVGTTNPSANTGAGVKLVPNAAAGANAISVLGSADSNTYNSHHLYSSGASAYRFYVGYGGTVYATNTTISAISDQRHKENIRDLDVGLDAVMQLKPRKFDWKEGKGKNIKDDRGFIAQEFEQVFPDLIDEWLDPAPEGEEPYKAVRQDLIPVLVKAIQELKAELDTVKAELATLKGQ